MKLRSYYINASDWDAYDRIALTFESRVICDLWSNCIGKSITTKGIWQIYILVHRRDDSLSEPNVVGGSLHVPVVLKPSDYFKLRLGERKVFLNNLVRDACLRISRRLGVDPSRFEEWAARVSALGYQRVWDLPRKRAPFGGCHARLRCVQDIDCFRLWLVGSTVDGESTHHLVATSQPDSLVFAPLIGSIKWIGNENIEVKNKNGLSLGRFNIRISSYSKLEIQKVGKNIS